MNRRHSLIVLGALLPLWLLVTSALALALDGFDLGWHVSAGGGGRASSAAYALEGTIGQPAVGHFGGEGYALGSGLWYGAILAPSPGGRPEFSSTPDTVAVVGLAYSYAVTAYDPDAGDTLTITAPTRPAWLALTDHGGGSATLDGTPSSADLGEHAVILQVRDTAGLTGTQSFSITVGADPLPDLSLSRKWVNRATFDTGDTLTYTLVLFNRSDVPATANLVDQIPGRTTYTGGARASDGNPVTLVGGALRWSGLVIQGTPVIVRFSVQVTTTVLPAGTVISNYALLGDGLGHIKLLAAHSTYNPGYGLTIDDGALYTNIPTVTLSYAYDVNDNIMAVKFSNDGGFGAGSTAWLPVSTTYTYEGWGLVTYGDLRIPRTVYAKFRDTSGDTYGPIQDDIIYDPVAPPVPHVEIMAGTKGGLLSTPAQQVTVRVVVSDDNSGIGEVHLSHSADFEPFSKYPATGETTDIPWTLQDSGNLYVLVVDRAGNRSEINSVRGNFAIYLPLVLRDQ